MSEIDHPLQAYLETLYLKYKLLNEGKLASYIPELAKADPDWFSICVVTVDGRIFEVGDADHLFTIQFISKVFVYDMALAEHLATSWLQFYRKEWYEEFVLSENLECCQIYYSLR
ncbi:glutaminase [Phormidesmis sp. 146-12]